MLKEFPIYKNKDGTERVGCKEIDRCKICGAELKWGGFAYDQEECWECFKKRFIILLNFIDQTTTISSYEREMLTWMFGVVEERYNDED